MVMEECMTDQKGNPMYEKEWQQMLVTAVFFAALTLGTVKDILG
jgi:hypothetical protein